MRRSVDDVRLSRAWIALAACCALAPAAPVRAVEIGGYLILGEAYTDNVALAPDGLEEDDFITQVKPGITVNRDGKNLDFDIDYYLEALFYANESDRDGVYSNLASNGILNVIDERLQLLGQAAMSQVNVTPSSPVTDSNIFVTDNRTDAVIWDVGPALKWPVLGQSELEASYLFGRVSYDDDSIQDAERQNASAVLRQRDEAVALLDYELVWTLDKIDYEETREEFEVQELYLQLGYEVAPSFRLTALGGLDSDFRDPTDSSLSESRWEVGFDLELNDNVISAGVGERYFGTTYRAAWRWEVEDQLFRLSYSEAPGTSDLLSFREIPTGDPDAEPLPPESGINRPGTVSRFIRRRFDARYELTGFKSVLGLELVWDEREDVTAADVAAAPGSIPDESGYGAGIEYRYLLGQKSTLTANAAWREREYAIADEQAGQTFREEDDTVLRLLARIDYELGLRTAVGLQVRFDRRSGTSGALQDYEQFLVLADLVRRF